MTDEQRDISDFLSNTPLYKKMRIPNGRFIVGAYHRITFDFECKFCKADKTFSLEKVATFSFDNQNSAHSTHVPSNYRLDLNEKNNYTEHYKGLCKACSKYAIDFVLNTSLGINTDEDKEERKEVYFLRKIGQNPPHAVRPDKIVDKYLLEEDKQNYSQAMHCLSMGYGIAAYAYFRRIVENEIKRIIKDIGESGNDKVKDLYEKFEANQRMNDLVEGIYPHLPASLRDLGQNPIKYLYSQLSEGLHNDPNDVCIEKSNNMQIVLSTVIEEISRDKTKFKEIRKIISSGK